MKRFLENELIAWKNRQEHLPLLLRGARQVGKSYLVEQFGKNHFQNVIVVDFERRPDIKNCFYVKEPAEIVKQLEVFFKQKIIPGSTLLFFDEIQECPDALVSLRYFKELMPELHVIAAGSLMEFLLHDDRYSFPVGRVEFLYLRPLSFSEFLYAQAPVLMERLDAVSQENRLYPAEHEELLKWVRKYLFIGGMPAAVQAYISSGSLLESQKVHERILQAYENDFGKYATHTQHRYLQLIYRRSPHLITQVLKYSHIDREARSRDLKPALHLLVASGLLTLIFATNAKGLPLHAHMQEHRFKLLFLDVGLLQTCLRVDATSLFEKDILQINAGMLAEQFVGQELLAHEPPYSNRPLLFWEQNEGSSAEIDYVQENTSTIYPIEVKAGAQGTLRSLKKFLDLGYADRGIRVSEHPLQLHENILSIPLYLIAALKRLLLLFPCLFLFGHL